MAINHVGIIPDGNRRWAKAKGLNPWEGHRKGAERVKEIIDESLKLGVKNLTIYTFSLENFKRDKLEIEFLMKLFKKKFGELEKELDSEKKGIKIRFAGDRALFPKDVQSMMNSIEEKTKENKKLTVNFAMSYGGRNEILSAVKNIIKNKIPSDEISEDTFSKELYVKENVDLIIRTSGEKRISGFLPWQCTYAEFMFIEKFWPDFTKEDFKKAVNDFEKRNRRFGQ